MGVGHIFIGFIATVFVKQPWLHSLKPATAGSHKYPDVLVFLIIDLTLTKGFSHKCLCHLDNNYSRQVRDDHTLSAINEIMFAMDRSGY